ncbi:exopolyphosphatase/guanosine-5'-triphosphate,3'-diphosphate pyrophosphatase [Pedobacter sp. CG_S7]|uniref:Ppx/GppA phosphatase family protein n=1 Tax=Pedobacter sp. CG_S7 TaxID=3143930 RepID=UPI0033979B80
MKAAVIDLGTNTFHLVIANIADGKVKVLYKTNIPVKLGEGRLNENIIIPEAFERGLQALLQFKEEISKHQVTIVKATATSAIRSAINGSDFVKAAKEKAGIAIEVINGEQEASYIFKGVQATGVITQTSLIIDIGGGSTEFILCRPDEVLWKKSYNIGAARLMQAFFNSDPINAADQLLIKHHLATELSDLKLACTLHRPTILIGSAGAFETFAVLLQKNLDLKSIASTPISLPAYRFLAAQLIASTHQERKQIEGLIPLRVDMIVMAAMITNYVLDEFKLTTINLSTYDLKMGVLYSLASKKTIE